MAQTARRTKSGEIRAKLDYPIIDADGHLSGIAENYPEYLVKFGGSDFPKKLQARMAASPGRGSDWDGWGQMSWEERRDRRARRPAWWGSPTKNTRDAATAALPNLLLDRLDELGIDYFITYGGLTYPLDRDDEFRRVTCRAFNASQADLYREYAYRITPAAAIPMYNPQEAIDELEYCVKTLGYKVIMTPTAVQRPIPAVERKHPGVFPEASWLDNFCLDSEYDYDPFWAKCVELKMAVTTHTGVIDNTPWYGRSISNFVFNHLGNHAYHQALMGKALFLAGVTRRFPTLNIAFLEGGVGWAVAMYAEIIGAWEKRSVEALENTNPANLDRKLYGELAAKYGSSGSNWERRFTAMREQVPADLLDEWAAAGIRRKEDIRDRFIPNFYFGCEADDPINTWAFNKKANPMGVRFNATLGSDIGHYDVPDMSKVVEEAHEQLEDGLMEEGDFKDFVFGNAVRLHAGMNPDFFKGTAVEADVQKLLGANGTQAKR